jgi:hypothetical protein
MWARASPVAPKTLADVIPLQPIFRCEIIFLSIHILEPLHLGQG